ncbi:GAF domain-containing protein [Krasilnikovia sp. MM14-A1259]|uniref:GAF domain-containing protein n=1 Tax=Krasilnikovia sp. MM14-A1259 TaxID=3373539 RepID=UPI0038001A7B
MTPDETSGGDDPGIGLAAAGAARPRDDLLGLGRSHAADATQGRLCALLRGYLDVARADDLDSLLQHLVDTAKALVGARYAALGVVSQGTLVRFLYAGVDQQTRDRIGCLPEGKGVLGLLVERPEPVRLADISTHVLSVGFPEHHPPMRSFLGVPVQVGRRVFGHLYLTEKQGAAEFTGDDEQLVVALTAAAGVAIENAIRLREGRRRQAFHAAMARASTDLLAGAEADTALCRFGRAAQETLGGAGAVAAVPAGDDPDTMLVTVADGIFRPWRGARVTVPDSVLGDAVELGGLAVADSDRLPTGPPSPGPVGQSMAVPLRAERELSGVLLVSRRPGAEGFDALDREIMAALAAQAGLVLRLARAREDTEQLRLLEDRQQIGEELRGRAIHRLFRHGLALQCLATRLSPPAYRDRLQDQIEEVDGIIRDIRDTVLSLEGLPDSPGP